LRRRRPSARHRRHGAGARRRRQARRQPRPAGRLPRHAPRGMLPRRGRRARRAPPRRAPRPPPRPLVGDPPRPRRRPGGVAAPPARVRRVVVWLLVVALGGCAGAAAPGPPAPAPVHLAFLQVNDDYSLEPVDGGARGGMARLATLVREARRENPHTLFALAGDTLSPSVMSTFLEGEQMVAGFNAAGLD